MKVSTQGIKSCNNVTELMFIIHFSLQNSDEPPYDNWRRSELYSGQGGWDRSYKVLPGEEEEEQS